MGAFNSTPSPKASAEAGPAGMTMTMPLGLDQAQMGALISALISALAQALTWARTRSQANKMRSGVAGASMCTTAWWLALAETASRKAK